MPRPDLQFTDLLATRLLNSATPAAVAALALRIDSRQVAEVIARNASAGLFGMPPVTGTDWDPSPWSQDPAWALVLARVMALRRSDSDPAAALTLIDQVRDQHGTSVCDPETQVLYTQLLARLAPERVKDAAGADETPPEYRWAAALDACNPFIGAGPSVAAWSARLAEVFLAAGLDPVGLEGTASRPFDRLRARPSSVVDDDAMVSVIMSAYCPDRGILTAVRSVLDQSWTNIELLIVDDASPPQYAPLFSELAELDERIRVIKAPVNGGTYQVRNLALDYARGEFVTFHDSDDWAHPRRVEHQVAALRSDEHLLATRSWAVRAFPDLTFTYIGYPPARLNASSLLFRRQPVMNLIGYFDAVRKSADIEFPERLQAVAPGTVLDMTAPQPLAICQLRHGSLSRSDAIPGWLNASRLAYRNAYRARHQQIRKGEADAFFDGKPEHRQLPLPEASWATRPTGADPCPRYDVIVQADWRRSRRTRPDIIADIHAMRALSLKVAVSHAETHEPISHRGNRERLSTAIQELINSGVVDLIDLSQPAHADLMLVYDPASLQLVPDGHAAVKLNALAAVVTSDSRFGRAGTAFHVPDCDTNAERRYGCRPMWIARDARARAALPIPGYRAHVADSELPIIFDAAGLAVDVRRPRSGPAVLGRHVQDRRSRWPATRTELLRAYPNDPRVDVRIMGGHRTPLDVLGSSHLPDTWVSFTDGQLDTRTFLAQLDFFVYMPREDEGRVPGTAALEAIASGCVVLLPPRFESDHGPAALYCDPADVSELVSSLRAAPARYSEQQERARAYLEQRYGVSAFQTALERILAR